MAGVSSKEKKTRNKNTKSRPPATSATSQPVVEDAWSSSILSSFSTSGDLFAFVSLAIDKHRLRIYDVKAGQAVSEHILERARVTSLTWISFIMSEGHSDNTEDTPSKKRRKGVSSGPSASTPGITHPHTQCVVLGLSDGSVQVYSALSGRVLRTLAHPNCTSPALAAVKGTAEEAEKGLERQTLWVSYGDSALRLWDLRSGELLTRWQNESQAVYSAITVRPTEDDEQASLLVASHTITLLSTASDASSSDASGTENFKMSCIFSGHASPIKYLQWLQQPSPSKRFVSSAENDRFVYVWDLPDSASKSGKLAASCSLDSNVLQICVMSHSGSHILLTLSTSGKITLLPIPSELAVSGSSKKPKQQVPTLLPRSTAFLSKTSGAEVRIIAVSASPTDNSVRVALLSSGIKVAFDTVAYLDQSGDYIPEIPINADGSLFIRSSEANGVATVNHRYQEPATLAIGSGEQKGQDQKMDDVIDKEVEGALDVDLAEMSLGQRLAARTADGADPSGVRASGSDQEDDDGAKTKRSRRKKEKEFIVPANSLSRTLIQALHSSDTGLLESCLLHSDDALIRNTVQRLPPQLAVPLLTACVERLGRGGRSNNMKGRGGGASAQRGMGIIAWVKAVLTIHSGHLMTMPDLVARLSNLHSTLTTRLTLQERLLTLNGRLDLVLSQVELRSSTAPAPLVARQKRQKKRGTATAKREPLKYVEGESTDEDAAEMNVEVEEEDDDESVEDVQLGGDSEDEDDEDDDGDESEDGSGDEGGSSDEGNLVNGFIDDEAEDNYEEDESEEESE